ncbi:MAG: acetylxylan esterase [Planctomycetes bacterium]|nr:acetylxylan esterase [Planctomycetota bacterium]
MICRRFSCLFFLTFASISTVQAADKPQDLASLLAHRIISAETPVAEVRKYIEPLIPPMPAPETLGDWEPVADRIRQDMFDRVVLRGEAAQWSKAETKVEWLETLEGGPGYKIRKLRYEAVPGLWIPALLYLPDQLEGRVPVVMNVNGHDPNGKWADYKQIRCINQARRGMIALNPEWLGMGQLAKKYYAHYGMNQIDLCGTSGLAPFYLSMKRGLDVLLSLENADPERVAVAGLSGGGWQTIFISSLDTRVTLANPVAGYSSFLTRLHEPADLGDSEQTPCDMATVADYCHLTALRAPRPTLLTNNASDNCCFVAGGALPPLLQAAGPIFKLYGKQANLRSHVNYLPGTHNFELDNRLQLYRMLGEHFYPGDASYAYEEFACQDELKTQEQLHVELPEPNANFNSLATALAADLPRNNGLPATKDALGDWQAARRKQLAEIVKSKRSNVAAKQVAQESVGDTKATYWLLKVGDSWSVPAVELTRGTPDSTVLLVADEGRAKAAAEAEKLLADGYRVLAVDPFYFGESKISTHDFLFGLLVAAVGERPLGIQATQVAAISRWANEQFGADATHIHAVGPRASLYSLVAAAIEPTAIGNLHLHHSFGSLKEIIEQNITVNASPELFCFGLLEHFDIKQLAALVAPRQATFVEPSERVQKELAELSSFYKLLGVDFNPLR